MITEIGAVPGQSRAGATGRSGRNWLARALGWMLVVVPLVGEAAPIPPAARRLTARLEATIVAEVKFDQIALADGLAFLAQAYRDGVKGDAASASAQLNFVDLRQSGESAPVTLELSRVPVSEALRYLCLLAGCRYAVESEAVVLTDHASVRDPGGSGGPRGRPGDGRPVSRDVDKLLASAEIDAFAVDDATLAEALDLLKTKVTKSLPDDAELPPLNFVLVDPDMADTRVALTMRDASARAILGYLMELAGCEYLIEAGTVTIRARATEEAAPGNFGD